MAAISSIVGIVGAVAGAYMQYQQGQEQQKAAYEAQKRQNEAAAIEAMQATGFEMLIETPFTLHFHMAVRSYGSIDMDNAITTALDALQGVAYDNDKFCCKVVGTKALLGKHELVRTEIRIEALD